MKRLSIADIKATEILSIEEKKSVVGGVGYVYCKCNGVPIKNILIVVDESDYNAYTQIYCGKGGTLSCKDRKF